MEAYDQFVLADARGPSAVGDLEGLALAAFFAAQPDVEDEAKERAFTAYGPTATTYAPPTSRSTSPASTGYAGKLVDRCGLGPARRAALGPRATRTPTATSRSSAARRRRAAATSNGALALAEQAIAIGERPSDPDLRACALTNLGELKIATGATRTGSP